MAKRAKRHAFTLIEVMVAVMIVSVVIATLLQIQANASHKFLEIKKIMNQGQYNSFLLFHNEQLGFERSSSDMQALLSDFELESDLRRRLRAIKIKIEYELLDSIDTSKMLDAPEQTQPQEGRIVEGAQNSGVVFEIGRTLMQRDDYSSSLIRVRIR